MSKINRRQFMKKTIIMGATIAAIPTVLTFKSRAKNIAKLVVHPHT